MSTQANPQPTLVASEWIDRYVNEVGRRLPAKQRDDVERELRSLIEDEVLARLDSQEAAGEPQPTLDETVLAVLQQFDAPEQMVAHYTAPRYLIGPGLFPIFRVVLSVVLIVALFGSLIGLAAASGAGRLPPFGEVLASILGGLLQTAGMLVLVFALIEYFTGGVPAKETTWQPQSLSPVKDPDRVGVVEPAVEIGFNVAALLLFNFYLDRLGVFQFTVEGGASQWHVTPFLASGFAPFVPWLSAVWLLDILINALVLARGRWRPWLRVASIGVSLFGAAILLWILTAAPLTTLPALEVVFRISLAVAVAITLLDAGKHAWRLFNGAGPKATGGSTHLQTYS